MPEGISNYVTPINYRNPCIARGVSDIICLTSEPKSVRHQMDYEVRPEVSKVEDSIPSTRMREIVKTLESDSLVSYGWLPVVESVCDIIIEWLPTEDMNILARRTQFLEVPFRGASWSPELTLPTSVFGEWFTEYVLDAQSEEITGAAVLECVSAQAIEQIKVWGIRDQVETALGIIQDTFQNLRAYEANIGTDPEIPERKRLRITLTVSGTPEEVFADELRFKEWMCSTLDIKACELITITYHWEK
ncbi:hypothetical protein ES703_67384 [subsurface metagenome]